MAPFRLLCSALLSVAGFADDSFVFLDNGVIRVGVDATRGGSIGYLSQSASNYNVLNTHDMGREIQLSFYGGPNPYDPDGRCNVRIVWGSNRGEVQQSHHMVSLS